MTINIAGSYITQFGELWDQSLVDLMEEAMGGAIKDSKFDSHDIEVVFVANKAGGFNDQRHLNAMASQWFDHFPPAMRIEGACASGGLALLAAEYALLSGRYQTALVVGVEKMTDDDAAETTKMLASAADNKLEYGSTFPALYALLARIHMETFGTTREQLSAVSVKNHHHAMDNSQAQFHREFTLEQVSNSPLVADPLRLLDCSPITDGAAAVVLTTRELKNKVSILGSGHAQDSLDLANRVDLTGLTVTSSASKQALSQAGLTIKDITAAEVHDCFTIAEIIAIEDLGFVTKGKGGPATLEQDTTNNSGFQVVINPSGGLKACGHPVGATGVKQVAFLNKYLAKHDEPYALAHNVGGSGATAVVHILGKN